MSWPIYRIEDLVGIAKGKKHELSDLPTNTRFIQIDDLRNNENIKYTPDSKGTFVKNDDIVIAWDGANAGTVGFGLNGLIGSTLARLSKKVEHVDTEYLARFLQSKFRVIRDNCTGATIPHVSRAHLNSLKIPLPPLAEQKRIAAILDKADAIRRKRQQAIQLADDFLRAVFLDMFGDVSKFGSLEIKEVASKKKHSLSSGPFGSSLTSKHYVEDGVIVLRGTNVTSGKMDLKDVKYISEDKAEELKRSALYPGDVVIVAVGASGRALRIPEGMPPAVMSQNFNKITPNTDIVTSTYLEYCFNSALVQRQFAQNTTDTVRTFLSLTKIKEVKIPVPPISLQHKFEKIIGETVCQIAKVNDSSLVIDTLFNSLSQKAFSGEL